jgi:hypothetical protein
LVGLAGTTTAGILLRQKTITAGATFGGIALFTALSLRERIRTESQQTHVDDLVITAIQAILADMRTNKLNRAEYAIKFDFAPNAPIPCTLKRQGLLTITRATAYTKAPVPL